MGTTFSNCCLNEYNDARHQSLIDIEQKEPEPHDKDNEEDKTETDSQNKINLSGKTVPNRAEFPKQSVPPWDKNSIYHNRLTYVEMSQRYLHYRKPPDFYDACIRKIKAAKKRQSSTKEQSQYDTVIQATARALLRTRTRLTASMEEQQQFSQTNLIHGISEDDQRFWFQPFLYPVIENVAGAFTKLLDSKQDFVLNHTHFYHILQALPVLNDILCENYPFHYHNQLQGGRLKYLFNQQDVVHIETKQDIVAAIATAKKSNRKICAVGYANSWAANHLQHDATTQPLIAAMIPNHLRTHTYDIKVEYAADLSRASVPNYPLMYVEDIGNHKIRVGGATPVWLYRDWCHARMESNKSIPSEPSNAMSLNHSFVGLITVGEHGAGITASTLTDYVTQLTVINSEGVEKVYSIDGDEKEFKSLLPHLGLLGIVTQIELQFKKEYYCNFNVKVIATDKLFPKSKSKKTKGRTFSKAFEDMINSTFYHEFFWYPSTNQVYCLSLTECDDDSVPWQFFPNKTWEKNWRTLQSEVHILNEILSIQLLNGPNWCSKLCTKLITKISVSVLNHLVLNIGRRGRRLSNPLNTPPNDTGAPSIKLPSCDALHLCEFYPSQSNNNLFQNVEWLFPLESQSGAKILINDRHVANVELAARVFMTAVHCYNQIMTKKSYFPYQYALSVKVIKGSECGLSHCIGADFYCAVSICVYDIENNEIFEQFQREFMEACKTKIFEHNSDGIKQHWRNVQIFKYLSGNHKENGYIGYKEGGAAYTFVKSQYKESIKALNQIRQRDNENAEIFGHPSLHKIFQ